jgi:hypothetical protein
MSPEQYVPYSLNQQTSVTPGYIGYTKDYNGVFRLVSKIKD